jgi:hypothetical protein
MDDRDFYWALVMFGLVTLHLWVHSRHLRLHDEMLATLTRPGPDAELAAMRPADE